MDIVWEGFKLGLLLAIMVGPIFFAIIQTSVEEGFVAGAIVGAGIWFSDILYILFVYFGISYVSELLQNSTFTLTTGLIGSLILVGIGIGFLLSKAPSFSGIQEGQRNSSLFHLFSKGFLINAVNPFTVFFWFSVTSTMIVNDTFNHGQATLFYGTIILTIMCSDLLKAYLAKLISEKLTQRHIQITRKITGAILILFGIGLLVKVFLLRM